jgi:hypothetical protein
VVNLSFASGNAQAGFEVERNLCDSDSVKIQNTMAEREWALKGGKPPLMTTWFVGIRDR